MTQPPSRIRGSTGQPEGAAPKRDLTRSRTGRVHRADTVTARNAALRLNP
jgi:hypothetical protein